MAEYSTKPAAQPNKPAAKPKKPAPPSRDAVIESVLYEHRPFYDDQDPDYWHPVVSVDVNDPSHDVLLETHRQLRVAECLRSGAPVPFFDIVKGTGR